MRKTIVVKGPALSRSGYGEQTRYALRSLRSREDLFDIYLINIPWGQTGQIEENNEERRWFEHLIHKTIEFYGQGKQCMCSLQVTIPNEWETMTPINIGYTAGIETNKVSPEWIEASKKMDNIMVISNHSKQVYENTSYNVQNKQTGQTIENFRCQTRIDAISYPVREYEEEPLDIELTTEFNFLIVNQWGVRKNLDNTIRWFIEEFQNDEDVGLVVKTNLANNSTTDGHVVKNRLALLAEEYPDRKCKIYLLHGSLTEENMTWLYRQPTFKALISLTHGEGFGLPIFESAYNGLPIICPLWSGQTDFLYTKNKNGKLRPMVAKVDYEMKPIQQEAVWEGVVMADSMWCYPTESSYKRQLREVHKNPTRFKAAAAKLKDYIKTEFEAEKMYDKFCRLVWQPEWGTMETSPLELEIRSFE